MTHIAISAPIADGKDGAPSRRPSNLLRWLGWLCLALPVAGLAIVSVRTSVNIPFRDDYGIGEFLERYISSQGFTAKLQWFFASQHVQYKLMFLHAVELAQYYCIGYTDYRTLQLLGDAALLGVPIVLWFLLARSGRPLTQRVWLLAFPCYLFLSPRYWQTVNWALSGLQNIAVIPFAMAAIFFITAAWRRSFAWSLAFLVLCIATSGNGFFVAAVLLFFLLRARRYPQAAVTVAVSLAMAALYAYHYHVYSVAPPPPLPIALRRIVIFPFVFLGAAMNSLYLSALVGILLVVGFVVLARKGWLRACPGSFGVALFCLITAAGVSLTRSEAGASNGVAGRYMMYGLLLLCVEYLAILRLYAPERLAKTRWSSAILIATLAAAVVCLVSDLRGGRALVIRKRVLTTHLILWQRYPNRLVLVPDEERDKQEPNWIEMRTRFQGDLKREIAMGIYHPPVTALDPLPVRTHSPATKDIENSQP